SLLSVVRNTIEPCGYSGVGSCGSADTSSTPRRFFTNASLSMYFTVTATCRGVPVRPKTSLRDTETMACCPSAKPALSASMTPANTGAVWLNVPTDTVVDFHVLGTSDMTVQRISARSLLTDTVGCGGSGQVAITTAGWLE